MEGLQGGPRACQSFGAVHDRCIELLHGGLKQTDNWESTALCVLYDVMSRKKARKTNPKIIRNLDLN